jgi:lipopolysaccharide cholinephosphotransferase
MNSKYACCTNKIGLKDIQKLYIFYYTQLKSFFENNHISFYVIAGGVLGAVRHRGFIPWDDDIDFGMFRADYEKFLSIASQLDSSLFFVENYRNSKYVDHALTRICFRGTYFPEENSSSKLSKELYCDLFPLDFLPASPNDQEKQCKKLSSVKRKLYLKTIRKANGPLKTLGLWIIKTLLVGTSTVHLAKKMDCLAFKKYSSVDRNQVCSMMSHYSYKKQTMPSSFYGSGALLPFENIAIRVPTQYEDYLRHLYGPNYMIPSQRSGQSEDNVAFVADSVLALIK